MWGRLERPDKAGEMIRNILIFNTLDNLYTTHPPFQIDGNFGITAGVCEMLLNSHAGEIHILPAAPTQWKSGTYSGLLARGGFEIDATWKDGSWESAKVTSKLGNPAVVRLPGNPKQVQMIGPKGTSRKLVANDQGQFRFPTEQGKSYQLNP